VRILMLRPASMPAIPAALTPEARRGAAVWTLLLGLVVHLLLLLLLLRWHALLELGERSCVVLVLILVVERRLRVAGHLGARQWGPGESLGGDLV
jgi:hypothetical protein